MPIESSIPLQVRPLKLDPIGDATKALSLQKLLLGDRLRGAFVFDETPNGPQLNVQRTRQNLYSIDPAAAMTWEQQQGMRDHWTGQRAYQQQMLENQRSAQKIKAFNAVTQRMRSDLAGLYNDYLLTPGSDEEKMPMFQKRQDELFGRYRQQGLPVEQLQKEGKLSRAFDPGGYDAFLRQPESAFTPVAEAWVNANPSIAMTDEGDVVSAPESSTYDQGDLTDTEQKDEFVPTGGSVPLRLPSRSGATKPSADALKEIRAGKLLVESQDKTKPKELRDQLFSSAMWLKLYGKNWSPNESLMYDSEKKSLVPNPAYLTALKARTAITGKQGVTIHNYPPGAIQPGKKAEGDIQESLIQSGARMSRLNAIEQAYDPKWLQTGARLSATWNAVREKLGANLNPQDQQELQSMSQFKARAFEDLNVYIKELSGATVTDQERQRLLSQLPDPGDSWYNGDSPTQFKSKLDNAIRSVRLVEARATYMARNGLSLDKISLDRMPQIMRDYGKKSAEAIKKANPKISDQQLKEEVKRAIGRQFGITAD